MYNRYNTFLNLPESTIIHRQLQKKAIYEQFGITPSEQAAFDAEISRAYISNLISSKTCNVQTGKKIEQFYVLQVQLKIKEYAEKIMIKLTKLIPQTMILALCFEDEIQLALTYKTDSGMKFLHSPWIKKESAALALTGLDIDAVFENCMRQIAGEPLDKDSPETVAETLARADRKKKLQKQVIALQNKIRNEKQFNKQVELRDELRELERELERDFTRGVLDN